MILDYCWIPKVISESYWNKGCNGVLPIQIWGLSEGSYIWSFRNFEACIIKKNNSVCISFTCYEQAFHLYRISLYISQVTVFEPTCAICMVGSYASFSVCLSVCLSGLDQKSDQKIIHFSHTSTSSGWSKRFNQMLWYWQVGLHQHQVASSLHLSHTATYLFLTHLFYHVYLFIYIYLLCLGHKTFSIYMYLLQIHMCTCVRIYNWEI